MTNDDIDAILDLLFLPKLPAKRWNRRTQDCYPEACLNQNPFQTPGDIVLASEGRIYLAAPALSKFLADVFDQSAFLWEDGLLRQVRGRRHQKWDEPALLRIETFAPWLVLAEVYAAASLAQAR